MLSLFNGVTRPLALAWYAFTKNHTNIADVCIWQMQPSRQNYSGLPAKYRPSALQVTESYPCVIDWCPFSTIRDKLILMHSANPFLDTIISDVASAYVLEIDVAKVLANEHPQPGYVRVLDLISAMETLGDMSHDSCSESTRGTWTEDDASCHLPAPNLDSLFTSDYSRQVFELLRMDDGKLRYKLDPSLFIQYPELYDPSADLVASGFRIAPASQKTLPIPTRPDHSTMRLYSHFAEWSVSTVYGSDIVLC